MSINTNTKKIRTRFAPSPTGSLHLGGVRTALFNWLFARANNGSFILRIEDTDLERSTDASTQGIIDSMKWLGLNWDEGPFFQTKRMDIYYDYLKLLQEKNLIYPAFETKEELEAMRNKAIIEKRNPIYDRSALKLSEDKIQKKMNAGEVFVWRFKIPDAEFTDVPELLMANGTYRVRNDNIGDFIITRPGTKNNPGIPLYNFVCAVDDALMNITHVIRGVEHLPNAAKQVLIHQALGYKPPVFIHLPLIMKNGKKMSKRDKEAQGKFPVSVMERKNLGYLPEALLNHVALLGWSAEDGAELFGLNELKSKFSLDRLSKSNANFDEEKFSFINSHYVKNKDDEEIINLVIPFLNQAGFNLSKFSEEKLSQMILLEKKHCKLLSDFVPALSYFFVCDLLETKAQIAAMAKEKNINSMQVINEAITLINSIEVIDGNLINQKLKQLAQDLNISFAKLGPVIRIALTGRKNSPSLGEVIAILGTEESIFRLRAVLQ